MSSNGSAASVEYLVTNKTRCRAKAAENPAKSGFNTSLTSQPFGRFVNYLSIEKNTTPP